MRRRGGYRLPEGGIIDRTRPVTFTYDGRALTGLAGDTVGSALLANGVRLVGRSFRQRRPRGIVSAGWEEPNAVFRISDGGAVDVTARGTDIELTDGLTVCSTRAWPNPRFDLGSALGLLSFAFPAGFYYKTFMWPSWRFWEPAIRRLAGPSTVPVHPDPSLYDRVHACCDVLVVGGGPAGIAAAAEAVGSGANVLIADNEVALGGSMRWENEHFGAETGACWAVRQEAELIAKSARVLTRTVVVCAYDNNVFVLVETVPPDGVGPRQRIWIVRTKRVVLATGSTERPLVFENNDRPGVMLALAVRRYIRQYAVAPGRRIAIFTNNDSAYRTAAACHAAGIDVAAVIDERPAHRIRALDALTRTSIECLAASRVVDVHGVRSVVGVTVACSDGSRRERLTCDLLAVSGGSAPLAQLASQRGCRLTYDPSIAAFVPEKLPEHWFMAGSVAGAASASEAIEQGRKAGQAAAKEGFLRADDALPLGANSHRGAASVLSFNPTGRQRRMFVDLANDVTVADVALAVRENFRSVEHVKRYTTAGMGIEQGRIGNANTIEVLAAELGRPPSEVGTTSYRPPFVGVKLAAIACHQAGDLLAPLRRTPLHDRHAALGAVFNDFGGWMRPDHYDAQDDGRDKSVAAEINAVRRFVGLFDGSSLGKIEVVGPDAESFVDRFYTSDVTRLKPGRIRYSLMLAESGHIFDDGVVARLGPNRFLLGPSSGNADRVAAWLEEWHQTEWPALRVSIAPVTEQWGQVSVSGPLARQLLDRAGLGIDLSPALLPHMGIVEAHVGSVPIRIARVSFTGELQFELCVPASHVASLWDCLMKCGRPMGARPVGLEAWLRLRIEKGYLHVGTDSDGRTTPADAGMQAQVEAKVADFIGKRSLSMTDALREDRDQLVGLIASPAHRLVVGGRVLSDPEGTPPCATDGFVSSATYSDSLGRWVGLGLVRRGRQRVGEEVVIWADGSRHRAVLALPPFYDPEGVRLRA